MKTIIEPFRIKSVEPIRLTTRDEQEAAIRKAGYRIVDEPPFLRHFSCRFNPVG